MGDVCAAPAAPAARAACAGTLRRAAGVALVLALTGAAHGGARGDEPEDGGAPAPSEPRHAAWDWDVTDVVDLAGLAAFLEQPGDDSAASGLEELVREAAAFRENPVDVNSAGLAALARVPFMGPDAALRIVAYRRKHGAFASLEDLVSSGCVGGDALTVLRPYLRVGPPVVRGSPAEANEAVGGGLPVVAGRSGEGRSLRGFGGPAGGPVQTGVEWTARLRAGTSSRHDDSWPSGPLGGVGTFLCVRAVHRDRIGLAFACEKDEGESSVLDHVAWFARWKGTEEGGGRRGRSGDAPRERGTGGGCMRVSVGVGDFVGSWGQGLAFRSGNIPFAAAYPRGRDFVRGYCGAGEAAPRRGVFLSLSKAVLSVEALAARTCLDATVGDDGTVISVRSTGYHRTDGERAGVGALTESLLGCRARVQWGADREVAVSVLHFGFSPELELGGDVRRRFGFEGDALTVGSADLRLSVPVGEAGAEFVVTSSGGAAALAAARVRRGGARARVGLAFLSRNYWSPIGGGAPGVSGGTNGAVAWTAVDYRASTPWRAWAEARVNGRRWRPYALEMPDWGVTASFGGEVRARGRTRASVEVRESSRIVEVPEPGGTAVRTRRKLRLSLESDGDVPARLTLVVSETREEGAVKGSLAALGARVSWASGSGLSVDVGVTTARVEGSPGADVQYEPRLPGEFSLRSLNETGTRWYIRLQRGLFDRIAITVRASGGSAPGRAEFGIGIDAGG